MPVAKHGLKNAGKDAAPKGRYDQAVADGYPKWN
jgi:hypothetical protein